jgi:alpha-tubulin suppressor-like RCC1 family protein
MTETGAVFSCGCNAQGQLGVKSSTDRVLFERIPYLQKEDIVSIAAGARHRLSVVVCQGCTSDFALMMTTACASLPTESCSLGGGTRAEN